MIEKGTDTHHRRAGIGLFLQKYQYVLQVETKLKDEGDYQN